MNNISWTAILHHFGMYHYRVKPISGDIILKCVVHQERTPSLRLYRNSGRGKCYGCGWMPTKADFIRLLARTPEEEERLLAERLDSSSHFYSDDQLLFGFMEDLWLFLW